ncbi:hypothetical protein BJY21_002723 [Kineosphaera limosa]|uniref:Uncharacterized protein n=1 Tax=Kineosphaera limosa NBRC 100340 TaxID=1184609 RepID=K6WS70_9MICO|nr:hypothetical protein [Kineosphaera limosa]NYE01539.1 hypothetical protein [Kineosphaera limosa]GAB96696.1 hypothetical protein KILIM_045_00270 [Kineosphaera limosa NBRC 100340]
MRTPEQVGLVSLGLGDEFTARYPELYPNHVAIAGCIRAWAERMVPQLSAVTVGAEPGTVPGSEEDYVLGYARALRDMADMLVDGEGLPDAPLYPIVRTA